MNTTVKYRSTVVLGTDIMDALTHDGVKVQSPTFPIYTFANANSFSMPILRDVAVYQTQNFRKEKLKGGTEANEIWQDLLRRRVVQADPDVEFVEINGVFIPCTDVELIAFDEATLTVPPYRIGIRFNALKTFRRKDNLHKIINECITTMVEGI